MLEGLSYILWESHQVSVINLYGQDFNMLHVKLGQESIIHLQTGEVNVSFALTENQSQASVIFQSLCYELRSPFKHT